LPDKSNNDCASFLKIRELKKPQPANIMKARNPNGLQFILSYPS